MHSELMNNYFDYVQRLPMVNIVQRSESGSASLYLAVKLLCLCRTANCGGPRKMLLLAVFLLILMTLHTTMRIQGTVINSCAVLHYESKHCQ